MIPVVRYVGGCWLAALGVCGGAPAISAQLPVGTLPPDTPPFSVTQVCGRGAYPYIVDIRDLDGNPAAIGAAVTIRRPSGYEVSIKGFGHPSTVFVGQTEGGPFEVEVTKPWYASATVNGPDVPADRCGSIGPAQVSVELTPLPGAPSVRQVVTESRAVYGAAGMLRRLRAEVLADPGISREVTWVVRDTTVVRLMPDGTSFTTKCRSANGGTWIVASSVVNPAIRDSVEVWVMTNECP